MKPEVFELDSKHLCNLLKRRKDNKIELLESDDSEDEYISDDSSEDDDHKDTAVSSDSVAAGVRKRTRSTGNAVPRTEYLKLAAPSLDT